MNSPDCRRTYPWGREDADLLEHYRRIARIRTAHRNLFASGDLFTLYAQGDVYVYGRTLDGQAAIIALNRGHTECTLTLDLQGKIQKSVVLSDQLDPVYAVSSTDHLLTVNIPPLTGRILMSQ